MKSFWKRQHGLFAVALAASAAGTLWGLQPAFGGGNPAPPPVTGGLLVIDRTNGTLGQLTENPDGTAVTFVNVRLGPTVRLGIGFFENADYEVSVDLKPGQAGRGTGSGTGQFTMHGVYGMDFGRVPPMPVGPYTVTVDVAVTDAADVSASTYQGVNAQTNPVTGETRVVRQHAVGNQALGLAAGSLSIHVDDGGGSPGLVYDASGLLGVATANIVHTVEQIR